MTHLKIVQSFHVPQNTEAMNRGLSSQARLDRNYDNVGLDPIIFILLVIVCFSTVDRFQELE